MLLREWISELNAACNERELVDVVGAFVAGLKREGRVPAQCLPELPGNAGEIRESAAWLARLQVSSCTEDDGDRVAYQQLLVLFSLAVDRIAMLEARGLLLPQGHLMRRGVNSSSMASLK